MNITASRAATEPPRGVTAMVKRRAKASSGGGYMRFVNNYDILAERRSSANPDDLGSYRMLSSMYLWKWGSCGLERVY